MKIRQGDVWFADLEPVVGHEEGRGRPVVVVSTDEFNDSPAELVTVCPMTKTNLPYIPTRVTVQPSDSGMKAVGYIIGEQPRTISTRRLGRRLGAIRGLLFSKLQDILRVILGL